MSRLVPIAFVAAGVLAYAASSAAAPVSPPRASLRAFVCQRGLDPPSRGISVQSVMRPIPGTERLAVRFELLRRQTGATVLVRGGHLGTWISPANATLGTRVDDVWQVTKSVVDLAAPADYRFRVSFRWLGRHGRILGQAMRLTEKCHQPELRPDLVVKSIAVSADPLSSTVEDYTATVQNDGASPTGPFQLGVRAGKRLRAEAPEPSSRSGPTRRSRCASAARSAAPPIPRRSRPTRPERSMTATGPTTR